MDWNQLFEKFSEVKVGVLGDVMLDKYVMGKVTRVSPEAPVPIVEQKERFNCLGGAANVALNIKALGAKPILFSVLGNDTFAEELLAEMKANSLSEDGLVSTSNRITTTKERVIGNNQQLLRIDHEQTDDIAPELEDQLLKKLHKSLSARAINVLILQDYNKGLLTEKVIKEAILLAKQYNVETFVDPKWKNFFAYAGVTYFKPNLKELSEALKIKVDDSNVMGSVETMTEKLESQFDFQHALITLSEHGMLLKSKNESHQIAAHVRNVADVSGAGDTVIATLATARGAGGSPFQAAELANLAGGIVCESVGVVAINKDKLQKEAREKLNGVS